jgi:O-antigen/teichoic acid export membrane protein
MTGGQGLMWVASSALVVLLPRYLGDTNLGKLTFAFSLTALFMTFVLFGSNAYIARAIAREPERAPHLTYNALISRLPFIAVSVVAIVAFLVVFDYPQSTRTVVYIATAALVLAAVQQTIGAAFQGLERMTLVTAAGVVEKVIVVVFGVGVLALASNGLVAYALVLLGAAAAATAVQFFWFVRTVGLSMKADVPLAWSLTRGGTAFFLWSISLIAYGSIDILLLSLMTDDEVVGWYGVAYRFIAIPAFIPFAVTTALLPALSSTHGDEFRAIARRCMDLVVMTSLPIALGLLVGAGVLIETLDYGDGFDNSVVLIRILSLHVPLVAVSMVAGTVLIALNREVVRTRMAMVAAVANPLANIAIIPIFVALTGNGAIGTAIITVCTELFIVTTALALVGRGVFDRSNVTTAARCLAAGAVMTVAMLLALPYGLVPLAAAGAAAYAIAALAFRAVRISELKTAGELLLPARRASEAAA